jgi:hypothetical protein
MSKRSSYPADEAGQPSNGQQAIIVTRNQVQRVDPYWLPTTSADPSPVSTRSAASAEATALGALAHVLQNMMLQQTLMLRTFDLRLHRLETTRDRAPQAGSFERATWWMLWGILMLIVGAALTVILFLIFSSVLH